MRILVIGGTRFIGAAAVRNLAAAGHQLLLFHRGSTSSAPDWSPGVSSLLGDRNALEAHATALLDFAPDAVLDMCCITARQCVHALDVFAGRTARYVLVSSCDVYRVYGVLHGSEDWPLDNSQQTEDSPLRTRLYPYRGTTLRNADDPQRILDDYDKIPCEQAVMAAPGGMAGTVLRLPMVYGPGDYQQRLLTYLKRMSDGRPAILLGETQAQWRGCRGYVEDVAAALALALTDPRAAGRVYNIAEPLALTEHEWAARIAASAGWTGELRVIPDAAIPEGMDSLRGSAQHLSVDSSRIRNELGFGELTPAGLALGKSIEWQRANYPETIPAGAFNYADEDALLAAL